jgi:hypothetical protein
MLPLVLLLPLVLAEPAGPRAALRVRRARVGPGLLPPLLLSLPSEVRPVQQSYLPPVEDAASSCRVVEEQVVEKEQEVQCRQVIRCRETIRCRVRVEEVCRNRTVFEEVEQCGPVQTQQCEEQPPAQECNTVTEEKCEEAAYQTEYKEECEYDTVEDKVCSSGYSVSYSDQCLTRRLPGRSPRRLCRKVPQYPNKTCRLVPRQVPRCRQVAVPRPGGCRQVQRQQCRAVLREPVCRALVTVRCRAVPVARRQEQCGDEETQQCTAMEEDCGQPAEDCRQVTVERPVTVVREVCEPAEAGSAAEPVQAGYLSPSAAAPVLQEYLSPSEQQEEAASAAVPVRQGYLSPSEQEEAASAAAPVRQGYLSPSEQEEAASAAAPVRQGYLLPSTYGLRV